MRVYITWNPILGADRYYIYRFSGSLNEVWQYRDEFYKPDGGCSESETYPIDTYLGSTEHFNLVGITKPEDVPPKWNITYMIDNPDAGDYLYIVRSVSGNCAGPISDPATITVEGNTCPEDKYGRYDSFKIEGDLLRYYYTFTRPYGYEVRLKEVKLESNYPSSYPRLIFIRAVDDPDSSMYIYLPANAITITEVCDIYSEQGLLEFHNVTIDDWYILYNDKIIEHEPPIIDISTIEHTSIDVVYKIYIDSLPNHIFQNVLPDYILDKKHIEGQVLSGSVLFARIYPIDGRVRKFYYETDHPYNDTTILNIGTVDDNKVIEIPPNITSYMTDIDININDLSYFMVLAESNGGTSAHISIEIEKDGINNVCVPFECIDYDGVWFEGNVSKLSRKNAVYTNKGMITRIYVHSNYVNELNEDTTIRIKNENSGVYTDAIIPPGHLETFVCGHLPFKAGDEITIQALDDTSLVSVNVLWELWYCGYDYYNEEQEATEIDMSYTFIDGWKLEGAVIPSVVKRYRTYPFRIYMDKLQFDMNYLPDYPIVCYLKVDTVTIKEMVINRSDLSQSFNIDEYINANSTISVEFESSGNMTSIDIVWFFSVSNVSSTDYIEASNWIRDHAAIEGANVSNIYASRYYDKHCMVRYLSCYTRYPVSEDVIIYLENKNTGATIACEMLSGSTSADVLGELYINPTDEVQLKTTELGSAVSINVDWKLYDLSNINIDPSLLDFMWFWVEGAIVPLSDLWVEVFSISEKIIYVEISTFHNDDDDITLRFTIDTGGYFDITIPAGTNHLIEPVNATIPAGSTVTMQSLSGSTYVSMNINFLAMKNNS